MSILLVLIATLLNNKKLGLYVNISYIAIIIRTCRF